MKRTLSITFQVCVILSLFISCKPNPKPKAYKTYEEKVTTLPHNSFCPSFLIYLEDHLLLIRNNRDTIFELIDLKTDSVKKFGLRGRGPDEFLYISDAYNDNHEKIITLVDEHSKSVYRVTYEDMLNCDLTNAQQLKLPASISSFTSIRLTNKGWAYGDLTGDAMVKLLAKDGSVSRFNYQPQLPYTLDKSTKAYAYYSAITYNSKLNKTVVALRYFPYVFILNDNGTLYRTIKTDEKYDLPIFKNENLVPAESSMIYCWEVHTTDKHIYVVNAGVTQGEFEQEILRGTNIQIYDWEGNQVSEIKTDFAFVNLALDLNNGKIYGSSSKDMYRCISWIPLKTEID
ncbi:MAG: BF3164 family lipoprotein [Lentimicrobiaceae bacterium]|nr:BF3164 family lipoprotein [Lentimicrobiaceae bacterium]